MRIAIVCSTDNYSGPNRLAAWLAYSLKGKGFDIACVSLKAPVKGKSHNEFFEIRRWYVPKFVLPRLIYWRSLIYQQHFLLSHELERCEREFKPDFVINMLWDSGADVLRKVKAPKVQYVHYPFDLVFLPSRMWLNALCLKGHYVTLKKVHRFVCNSQYVKKLTYRLWGSYAEYSKFEVIYPCVRWVKFQRLNGGSRPRRVCYVGRIAENKGIDLVIDAFLQADVKESELVIAGAVSGFSSYYYIALKERLRGLRNSRIKIIENPSDERIEDIYSSSRCFANFYPLEHFGMCVIEAMASGTPPIVADGGGQRETVIHGLTGFRVSDKSNDISGEIAKFIRLLLIDDEVFSRMSMQAREHAKQFDESDFVKNWIKILEP